jgi:predicted lipoprotein with Yx(FWY)xxD motif
MNATPTSLRISRDILTEEKNMKIPALMVLGAASALALSACGGNSSSASVAADNGAAQTSSGVMHVGTTSLGKVLVDSKGMTLYVLSADGPNKSTCDAQCIQFWPAASPTGAGKLAVASGQTKTPDGSAIATVAGHPVYTFSQDQNPGDVNGEGINEFGGIWHAVSPSGQAIVKAGGSTPSSGSASTPAGGGGPYGGGGY